MSQVHVIRHKVLIEGRSIRSVARELHVSRNTVRKYLEESEPRRVERSPRKAPVREEAGRRIEKLYEELEGRLTGKQRLTGTRVVELLREDGFTGGSTVVREVLAERNRKRREVFIPLVHRAGEEAQVDFFEIRVDLRGQRCSVWLFLMHLPFSGYDFVWLYERCNQVAFLDGHVRAFAHLGGVPQRVIYDNLTPAVKRILGTERELTERFQALASTYVFEPSFARPGEGHDKGAVERRGQTVRLQFFTPVPSGESLEEISAWVQNRIREAAVKKEIAGGGTVAQRFEQEKRLFSPLPVRPFRAERAVPVTATRQSLVTVEGATYSVPSAWARSTVMAYVGVATVRFECRAETVSMAKAAKGARVVSYLHYQEELARKPQAVRQVAPELIDELGEPYRTLWGALCERHGERSAARVLAALIGLRTEYGDEQVRSQIQALLSRPRDSEQTQTVPRQVNVPARLSSLEIESGVAADYDLLLTGGASR
jgi:prepilin-type processing-associated H-X9-DG protein